MKKSVKQSVVLHSGGMDSSLCLALAIRDFGRENVLSLSIRYGQRHSAELVQASRICQDWNVDHTEVRLDCLPEITHNALTQPHLAITHLAQQPPNTLVTGRNGLMVQIAGIYAHHLGARRISVGVIGVESANSGYRDCSRPYMDIVQTLLRLDLDDPDFIVQTPIIHMTKKETLVLAQELEILEYLLQETITCYEGLPHDGCRICPACHLRNTGLQAFLEEYPNFSIPYKPNIAEEL